MCTEMKDDDDDDDSPSALSLLVCWNSVMSPSLSAVLHALSSARRQMIRFISLYWQQWAVKDERRSCTMSFSSVILLAASDFSLRSCWILSLSCFSVTAEKRCSKIYLNSKENIWREIILQTIQLKITNYYELFNSVIHNQ